MVDLFADPLTAVGSLAVEKYRELKHEDEVQSAYEQGWYDAVHDPRKRSVLDGYTDDIHQDAPFLKGDPDDKDWK